VVQLEALDDRALVTRVQEGDRDAFSTLVVRYQERVYNLVLRGLTDQDAALDVAQEVFLKAYRGLARFQGESQFFTWLFRITMNETITARRKRDRRGRPVSLDRTDEDGEKRSDPPAATDDPGAAVARLDDQALVQQAIAGLDDEQAQVLLLRDIDGRSYQEISEILECPLGSVKSRIHRARLALKDKLAPTIERQG
jgi:RNA polymerase sigma-70 factor (ECF subfamily)